MRRVRRVGVGVGGKGRTCFLSDGLVQSLFNLLEQLFATLLTAFLPANALAGEHVRPPLPPPEAAGCRPHACAAARAPPQAPLRWSWGCWRLPAGARWRPSAPCSACGCACRRMAAAPTAPACACACWQTSTRRRRRRRRGKPPARPRHALPLVAMGGRSRRAGRGLGTGRPGLGPLSPPQPLQPRQQHQQRQPSQQRQRQPATSPSPPAADLLSRRAACQWDRCLWRGSFTRFWSSSRGRAGSKAGPRPARTRSTAKRPHRPWTGCQAAAAAPTPAQHQLSCRGLSASCTPAQRGSACWRGRVRQARRKPSAAEPKRQSCVSAFCHCSSSWCLGDCFAPGQPGSASWLR